MRKEVAPFPPWLRRALRPDAAMCNRHAESGSGSDELAAIKAVHSAAIAGDLIQCHADSRSTSRRNPAASERVRATSRNRRPSALRVKTSFALPNSLRPVLREHLGPLLALAEHRRHRVIIDPQSPGQKAPPNQQIARVGDRAQYLGHRVEEQALAGPVGALEHHHPFAFERAVDDHREAFGWKAEQTRLFQAFEEGPCPPDRGWPRGCRCEEGDRGRGPASARHRSGSGRRTPSPASPVAVPPRLRSALPAESTPPARPVIARY